MLEEDRSTFSPFLKQCFVTAAIFISTVGHGCGVGFIGILAPQLSKPGAALSLTPSAISWIGQYIFLRAAALGPTLLVGNFTVVPVMSRYGRKIATYAIIGLASVGWFTMIMASNFTILLIGRIMQGLSFGMVSPLRSVMLGEYTSPKHRGAFLSTIALGQSFGIFLIHFLGSLLAWQHTGPIVISFFFISLVITMYSPESPSFLASKGRFDECRQAFRWLRGTEENAELEELINFCLISEKNKIEAETLHKPSLWEKLGVIKKPEVYKPIILMMHAYTLALFSGGNNLANYPTQIIGGLMGPEANVAFWMVFLDGQRLLSNVVAIFLINKLKRRTILFSASAVSIFAHVTMALYVHARSIGKLYYDAAWMPILLINLQVVTLAIGLNTIPNVIGGEVFPLEYRGIGGSVSLASVAISMFITLKTFPTLLESTGLQGTFMIYAGVLTYLVIVIWFLLPETKDRTLHEIEGEFRGRPLRPEEIRVRQSLLPSLPLPLASQLSLRKASVYSLYE